MTPVTLTRTGMWRAIGTPGVRDIPNRFIGALFAYSFAVSHTVPKGNSKYYRSPFLRDFWHLNVAMMTSNNALIPDPDKADILASKPLDWPFLHLGLRMCGWADTNVKYYLLGLPINYWGGAISLILGLLTLGWYLVRMQRKYVDMDERKWIAHSTTGLLTVHV